MKRFFLKRDGRYVATTEDDFRAEQRKPLGLGDVVAAVAQPVAKMIDAVAGTNVQGCGGCQKRKEALNALVPDVGKILAPNRENS